MSQEPPVTDQPQKQAPRRRRTKKITEVTEVLETASETLTKTPKKDSPAADALPDVPPKPRTRRKASPPPPDLKEPATPLAESPLPQAEDRLAGGGQPMPVKSWRRNALVYGLAGTFVSVSFVAGVLFSGVLTPDKNKCPVSIDFVEELQKNSSAIRQWMLSNGDAILDAGTNAASKRRYQIIMKNWQAQRDSSPVEMALDGRLRQGTGEFEITVFSDYFCKNCPEMIKKVKMYMEAHGGEKKFSLRTKFLPNSAGADLQYVRFTLAANLLNPDKALRLYSILFERQEEILSATGAGIHDVIMNAAAVQAELNPEKIRETLASKSTVIDKMIEIDIRDAARLRIDGTPTTVLDNRLFVAGNISRKLLNDAFMIAQTAEPDNVQHEDVIAGKCEGGTPCP